MDSLLNLLEQHLPISGTEWDRVEAAHKVKFPLEDRSRDSLKRKFQDLYRTKIPTGDPFIPPEVRRAKMIHQLMEERINSSDCEGTDNVEIIVDEEQVLEVDNGSVASAERPVVVSSATARPLVKVPLFMATRKRKIQE